MSKITTIKCDRCGTIPPPGDQDKMGRLRLVTPSGVFAADLCTACSSQVKSDTTFEMKGKPPGRKKTSP